MRVLSAVADVDSRGVEGGGRIAGSGGVDISQSAEHRRSNNLLPVCGGTDGSKICLVGLDHFMCLSRCDFLFIDLYRVVVSHVIDGIFPVAIPEEVWMGGGGGILFAVDQGDGDICDGADSVLVVAKKGVEAVRLGVGGGGIGICDVFWVDVDVDRLAVEWVYGPTGLSESAVGVEFGEPAVVSPTGGSCDGVA